MSMQWEILMVELHEIRAVNKCLQKGARPERTGYCSPSCSLYYIYKLDTGETVFKTQEQLNSVESFEVTVCGSCRLYNLTEVNMKTKSTVSSLKFIKLRLPASTGKQLVLHGLKEMENHFSTLLRNVVLVALGKFFPLVLFLIYVTTLAKSKYK